MAETNDTDLITRFLGTQSCAPQVGVPATTREDCSCRYPYGVADVDCPECDGEGVVEVESIEALIAELAASLAACDYCGESDHATADHAHVCSYCDEPAVVTEPERRCEQCDEELHRAAARDRRAEDWAAWGDARRDAAKDGGL